MAPPACDEVTVNGRSLRPTAVFDTYWRFAAERQAIYLRRLHGASRPWTDDPVLRDFRFTNAYRAADRVSQFLIRHVIYDRPDRSYEDVVFRILLFKLFNKISTWERLYAEVGDPTWHQYDFDVYVSALDRARADGGPIYSAAYVMPPPSLGEKTKAANHLRLIELMMKNRIADTVGSAGSLKEIYLSLRRYPSVGPFIGFQLAIDLNYSPMTDLSEMDYVVAGPGARDGIVKCFGRAAIGVEAEIIRFVTENQDRFFDRLELRFDDLFGRPLQLIDCQNLFCEVDKYSRVIHPHIAGISGRQRIKQRYRGNELPMRPWFPPKWGLDVAPETAGFTGPSSWERVRST